MDPNLKLTHFLLFFPTIEDGVPRTARSMSLTMGKVCMVKESQGSQRKHDRSFHGHSSDHSLSDLWVPAGYSAFTLAHMVSNTPSFLLRCSLPDSALSEREMMQAPWLCHGQFLHTLQDATQRMGSQNVKWRCVERLLMTNRNLGQLWFTLATLIPNLTTSPNQSTTEC